MIPAEPLQQLMAQSADVSLGITKMVGLRRHRIERRLKNLLFLSNRERLVHLLLDLAEQFGLHTDDGIQLRIKLSHQELGNLIGSTRETVTVILGQLKADRSVDGGRRKIVLTNPQRLAHSVNRQTPRESRPKMRLSPVLVAG
jgi:CRP-like cAMP-binding protein